MTFQFFRELGVSLPALIRGRAPAQLIIQTTDMCNAGCPQCGMRAQEKFKRSKLNTESMTAIIDRAAKNRVRALSFTGGEPFLFQDTLLNLISYARYKGIPYIRTGTNGFMFMNSHQKGFLDKMRRFARDLRNSGLYTFWISLDTWDAKTHEKNRNLEGVIDGIRTALLVFREEGIYPSANLGINRSIVKESITVDENSPEAEKNRFYEEYREGFAKFYSFAAGLGFTIANACYPMSMQEGAVYKAESSDNLVSYNDTEKYLLFKALYDVIPQFRGEIRIFTPRNSLRMLMRQYKGEKNAGFACYGGIDYFFVNSADGHAYPCGFRAQDDLGDYTQLDTKHTAGKPTCRKCDWECFRDPSNQTGALTEIFRNPLKTAEIFTSDRQFTKDWWSDLFYYFACSMFNFRTPPDYGRMKFFQK